MTTFQELNENLNEYYLIKECIKYSGKINIELEKQYDRLIKKYGDLENRNLYRRDNLSIEFIRKFEDKLDWNQLKYLFRKHNLNIIEFIREFSDKLDWMVITYYLELYKFNNIEFLREFQDKLNWEIISRKLKAYKLNTIEIITEFKDKLNI
jgi:hypothetical protein